jgi:molecular chaperone GrpE (heat shock protein)
MDQGFHASFMPKPFTNHPGSGMHTHVSLFKGEENAFYDPKAELNLSEIGRQFVAGILKHASEITAITNRLGLEKYGTAGDEFDPQIHEALMHDTGSDVKVATATKILQPGYKYKERILRPARVAVTDPAESPTE